MIDCDVHTSEFRLFSSFEARTAAFELCSPLELSCPFKLLCNMEGCLQVRSFPSIRSTYCFSLKVNGIVCFHGFPSQPHASGVFSVNKCKDFRPVMTVGSPNHREIVCLITSLIFLHTIHWASFRMFVGHSFARRSLVLA